MTPLDVTCPYCNAMPGQECRRMGRRLDTVHTTRTWRASGRYRPEQRPLHRYTCCGQTYLSQRDPHHVCHGA